MLAPDEHKGKQRTGERRAHALRFDAARDRGPRVVARGGGLDAARIVEAATAAGVPVVANPTLSQALQGVAVGGEVPETLYRALAAVFSLVYQIEQTRMKRPGVEQK